MATGQGLDPLGQDGQPHSQLFGVISQCQVVLLNRCRTLLQAWVQFLQRLNLFP